MQFDESSELKRLAETQASTEDIFDGVILHVKRDMVSLSNGSTTVREVIRHIGAVCVIPVTEDNRVIMERQFRYPLNKVILEIPAGKLDAPDEDRLSAIRRELREETGYSADEWTELGDFHPAPAENLARQPLDGDVHPRGGHFGLPRRGQGTDLSILAAPRQNGMTR